MRQVGTLESLDLFTKSITVFAVAGYVLGVLVTSVNDYQYGFFNFNPLRPRIAAAGIWFLIFLGLPLFLHLQLRSLVKNPGKFQKWFERANAQILFFSGSAWILGIILSSVFESPESSHAGIVGRWIFAVVIICAGLSFFLDFWDVIPNRISVGISTLCFACLIARGFMDMAGSSSVTAASITLWILLTAWVLSIEMNSRNWEPKAGAWTLSLGMFVILLAAFGRIYYPHIEPSWGGGASISVTVCMTKDSPVMPGKSFTARLLEETDQGLYVVGTGDSKATFVPRSEVSLISYSDSPSTSFH